MNESTTNLIDDLRLLQAPQPLLMLWWGLALLAVAVVIGVILWRRARARAQQPPSPAVIAEAREDALAELEKLRALLSAKNSRVYAIQVSGVIRRYVERRFGIRAPNRSTEEFLLEAQASSRLDQNHRLNLGQFLSSCDFLKFARAYAEVPELEQMHKSAVCFVKDTQAESEKTPAQPGEAS